MYSDTYSRNQMIIVDSKPLKKSTLKIDRKLIWTIVYIHIIQNSSH